jgi:RNA polymerase sigma-70 factor, ECF subfamily
MYPYSLLDEHEKAALLEELMHDYQKGIYLLAYSFVRDKGIAEDITQDPFIKCYKKMDLFRGEASLKTWIYTIAINLSKDYLRKWEYRTLKLPIQFFEQFTSRDNIEANSERSEEQVAVHNELVRLAVRCREVIVLYYFEDMKLFEIAEILGLNQNTVKTRLARGRDLLKKKLARRRWTDGEEVKRNETVYGRHAAGQG